LIWLLTPAPLPAATIRVPQNVPTIQQAINAATNGDIVLVAPGTYKENINFGGKAITVKSESGPADTIIDGNEQPPAVVTFKSGEGSTSVLQGFTIEGAPAKGAFLGAISIEGSAPTITRNIITKNMGGSSGIMVSNNFLGVGGAPQILDNTISNNSGAGIYLRTIGSSTIAGNIISGNSSGISFDFFTGNALILQNLIAANGDGVVWNLQLAGYRGPVMVNNTIADNSRSGLFFITVIAAQTQLINNIISARDGRTAVYCDKAFFEPPTFRNNNVFSASGTPYGGVCTDQTGINGNISADPLFLDPTNGLYYLGLGSPAIDAGDNLAPGLSMTDLDGDSRILDSDQNGSAIVDLGAFETPPNPGAIEFKSANFSGAENSGGATITIIRKGGDLGQVTVEFITSNGTAQAGLDYVATSGTVTFLNGESIKNVSVPLIDDNLNEPTETVNLSLANTTGGATLGARNTAVLSITQAGTLQFSASSYNVNEGGAIGITITRTGGSTGAVSVNFTTSDGTATAGSDYSAVNQSISFADGEVTQTNDLDVFTNQDCRAEGNETVTLTLSNPTGGAALGNPATAVLTIIDKSPPPMLDFDCDGRADVAIYRSTGIWFIWPSHTQEITAFGWGGGPQDIPVPADYDGDGVTDIAIYREGSWSIVRSSDGGNTIVGWGGAPQDIPVPADYDGDGKTDIAIYRNGAWSILRSSDGGNTIVAWGGAPQDIPIPADYDGDGKADIAIYRSGTWSILRSSNGGNTIVAWGGAPQDFLVPADYDGDGRTDIAIYRDGAWSILKSSDGLQALRWMYPLGRPPLPQDIPVPAHYLGDDVADLAIYRDGLWIVPYIYFYLVGVPQDVLLY